MVQEWHSRGCQCVWTELKWELRCWWCWQETATRATCVPWLLSSIQTADTCSPHLHSICNLATISKPRLSSLSMSLFRVSWKSGLMWPPFSFSSCIINVLRHFGFGLFCSWKLITLSEWFSDEKQTNKLNLKKMFRQPTWGCCGYFCSNYF